MSIAFSMRDEYQYGGQKMLRIFCDHCRILRSKIPSYSYYSLILKHARVFDMAEINTDELLIDEVLSRGVEEVIVEDDLRKKMAEGKQLRIKLGIDPTSPNLHIGRSIPLLKLRDFQQLGHQIVLIIGDATGIVGDTSDKDSERPMLEKETIEKNKQGYFEQAGKIIDLDTTELRYNSEWLDNLTYKEIGEHAGVFSVADFIARDNIKRRLDDGKRVSLREVLYPLMQGYDSVAIESDVEIGGTDQKFNNLAGRPLQEHFGQEPQNVVLGPLIPGLDGRKMSSSWGNVINLLDEPADMYGKVMSLTDDLVPLYFRVVTRVPLANVEEVEQGLSNGSLHPKEAKMKLAREIVQMYHDEDAALSAEAQFTKTFSEGGVPDEVQTVSVSTDALLVDVLLEQGLVESKTEFRRLVESSAIMHTDSGAKVEDPGARAQAGIYKIGKRRFIKILNN